MDTGHMWETKKYNHINEPRISTKRNFKAYLDWLKGGKKKEAKYKSELESLKGAGI